MSLQLNDQKQNELENVNEIMSVVENSRGNSKKQKKSDESSEEVVLENLNEVITFDVPISEVQTLNE